MSRSKHTEAQMIEALKQVEAGQNGGFNRAAIAALHSGTWIGAPVASLRCPIFRPGNETLSQNGKPSS